MKKLLLFLNTIKFKLFAGIIAFMLPVQALLIYSSIYSINVTQTQVAQSYRDMIALYMGQIDDRLTEVGNYLHMLIGLDENVRSMANVSDDSEFMSAKVRVYIDLSHDVLIYDMMESFFIYSKTHDDFVQVFNSTVDIEARAIFNDYVRNLVNEGQYSDYVNSRMWHTQEMGDQYFLFKLLKTEDLYVGAWTRVDNLKLDLSMITIGEKGASFFIDENANPMGYDTFINDSEIHLTTDLYDHYFTGNDQQYLVIGESSQKGEFSMVAIIMLSTILERLPFIQRLIFWISMGFLILLPMYFMLLRKTIFVPLSRMHKAMKAVYDGNLDGRIELFPVDEEFRIVNDTFNKMMKQIKDLKISIYEEKIIRQNAELMYLQMQVNPHFFLNTLSIIYSLARTKKIGLVQEMTLCLIKYFRYMFKKDSAFVSLGEELQHVKNYINIQQIRFSDKVKYEISVQDYLLDVRIPSLLIVMFVENSIKYAITPENTVCINVMIDIEKENGISYLKISIQDTGPGFPEETLRKLQNKEVISDDKGDHIGIWNVQSRLKMLYDDRAQIILENKKEGGASIKIAIPLD